MALMPRKVRAQQGTTAAPVKTPAEDWRLASGGLWTPGTAQLQERSGWIPGSVPAGARWPLDVQTTAASTFTIRPGRFLVQGAALQGAYLGVVDADTVRTIPGASLPTTGNYKAGFVLVHVYDQNYGDTQDGFDLEIVLGAAATSAGAAVYPTLTGNVLKLMNFTVDSVGNITLGGTLPTYTVPRGGILPVQATETTPGAYDGQYRDLSGVGLQRWNATTTSWSDGVTRPMPAKRVWMTGTMTVTTAWVTPTWVDSDPNDPGTPGMWNTIGVGSLQAPEKGVYATSCGMQNITNMQIRKNSGGSTAAGTQIAATTGNPTGTYCTTSATGFLMNAGDYLTAYFYSTASQTAGNTSGYVPHFDLTMIARR